MRTSSALLGIVAGAAAGAALGVLFAPAKGSETRKRIIRRGAGYAEDVKDGFNEYIDSLTEEYDVLKDGASDLLEKGTERVATLAGLNHGK